MICGTSLCWTVGQRRRHLAQDFVARDLLACSSSYARSFNPTLLHLYSLSKAFVIVTSAGTDLFPELRQIGGDNLTGHVMRSLGSTLLRLRMTV